MGETEAEAVIVIDGIGETEGDVEGVLEDVFEIA